MNLIQNPSVVHSTSNFNICETTGTKLFLPSASVHEWKSTEWKHSLMVKLSVLISRMKTLRAEKLREFSNVAKEERKENSTIKKNSLLQIGSRHFFLCLTSTIFPQTDIQLLVAWTCLLHLTLVEKWLKTSNHALFETRRLTNSVSPYNFPSELFGQKQKKT